MKSVLLHEAAGDPQIIEITQHRLRSGCLTRLATDVGEVEPLDLAQGAQRYLCADRNDVPYCLQERGRCAYDHCGSVVGNTDDM